MFSKIYYPFELINHINSTNLNVITNNIFRLIEKNGVYEKAEGFVFCIRYSKEKSKYVIDFGSKSLLDIDGICLKNYNSLKSETKKNIFLRFAQYYEELLNSSYLEDHSKLKSFPNRCAVFVNNSTEIYFISLCTMSAQRSENKKLKTKAVYPACLRFMPDSVIKEINF